MSEGQTLKEKGGVRGDEKLWKEKVGTHADHSGS